MVLKVQEPKQWSIEFEVLQKMEGKRGFPKVKSVIKNDTSVEILMQKHGQSLRHTLDNISNNLHKKTVVIYDVCIQIVSRLKIIPTHFLLHIQTKRLQVLHESGYIHNDIKPENVLLDVDQQIVYLIDFGLAEKYSQSKMFKHEGIFNGNKMFCSSNGCKGYSKSRRDDMQSLIFLYSYMVNGKLPWSDKIDGPLKKALKSKMLSSYQDIETIVNQAPKSLQEVLCIVFMMDFHETPPYEELIRAFKNELKKSIALKKSS